MKVLKFQQGGPAPEAAPAPGAAPAGGQGPEEQIAAMAQQIVEQLGPEAAAMLAQMIMQMLQGGGGGEQAAPQGEPVYARKGGKLVMLGRQ
ncbi:MAG: hypothetical protein ACOH2V_01275 [Candidatus Saccharimonadaceae bacterium]